MSVSTSLKRDTPEIFDTRVFPERQEVDTSIAIAIIGDAAETHGDSIDVTYERVAVFDYSDLPDKSDNLAFPGYVAVVLVDRKKDTGRCQPVFVDCLNVDYNLVEGDYGKIIFTPTGGMVTRSLEKSTVTIGIGEPDENGVQKTKDVERYTYRYMPSPDESTWQDITRLEFEGFVETGYDARKSATGLKNFSKN